MVCKLKLQQFSGENNNADESFWDILNQLVRCKAYQLAKCMQQDIEKRNEMNSSFAKKSGQNQKNLYQSIDRFNNQAF